MTYPQISFVDAPSEDANTRLDLNSDFGLATCRVEHDTFTLGAPSLEGDSDAVSAALGLRSVGWDLQIKGSKSAAYAVRTKVSRELLRQTNWVRVRLSGTSPVHYLKTYRGEFGALSLEFVKNESSTDVWRLRVDLDAEALLYGERVSKGPYTVTQTPTATDPMDFLLTGVEGDAPTSLRVSITPTEAEDQVASFHSSWLVVSVSSEVDRPPLYVHIGSSDGLTDPTGNHYASGSQYLEGSARQVTVPHVPTTALLTNISIAAPAGAYRVLLRAQGQNPPADSNDVNSISFWLERMVSGNSIKMPVIAPWLMKPEGPNSVTVEREAWVDLGVVSSPAGFTPPADLSGTAFPMAFSLWGASSRSGGSSIRLDGLLLIPVDGTDVHGATSMVARCEKGLPIQSDTRGIVDGDVEGLYVQDADHSTGYLYEVVHSATGGFPAADPAAAFNRIYAIAADNGPYTIHTGSTTYITTPGVTAEVTVSWYPRKLHL